MLQESNESRARSDQGTRLNEMRGVQSVNGRRVFVPSLDRGHCAVIMVLVHQGQTGACRYHPAEGNLSRGNYL